MKLLALAVCLLAALPHVDSLILGNMFGNLGANICQFCDYCQFVSLCGPPCTRSLCYLCKVKHHCTTTCRFCEKNSRDTSTTSTTTSPLPSSVPVPSSSDPTSPPSDSAVPAFDISRFDTSQLSGSLMGVISKLLQRGVS